MMDAEINMTQEDKPIKDYTEKEEKVRKNMVKTFLLISLFSAIFTIAFKVPIFSKEMLTDWLDSMYELGLIQGIYFHITFYLMHVAFIFFFLMNLLWIPYSILHCQSTSVSFSLKVMRVIFLIIHCIIMTLIFACSVIRTEFQIFFFCNFTFSLIILMFF